MEYEELKSMWEKYDKKLDNLEGLNKKILVETLSKKPRRKLFFLKYKSIYSIIIYPIILTVLLYSNFKHENIDWKLILGCVFTITVLVYAIYINLKTFLAFNNLDLGKDSVIESARKSNKIKSVFKTRYRNALITLPLLYWGIVLIAWNSITFNTLTTIFIFGLFILLFLYNLKGPAIHKKMIDKFEKEILELKEYLK
ncbi:MAG: hypothetical protein GX180_13105 [Enterococcus sp.]|nr:hypothetical protein [Enterococcus sp.]